MNNNESIFEKIDAYLVNKKSSEISLIFFMLFILIGFLVYSYIFPITEKKLKTTQKNLTKMSKKLVTEQRYLRSVAKNGDERYLIKKAKREIEDTKIKLEKTTYANTYVDSKLKELSYLLFNNQNWAKFLDSITLLAQKYKVKIKVLENNINEPNLQKIEQILNLRVDFKGNFKNILKFINATEESKLVVDIYEINLESKSGLNGYINIAVWGMKY